MSQPTCRTSSSSARCRPARSSLSSSPSRRRSLLEVALACVCVCARARVVQGSDLGSARVRLCGCCCMRHGASQPAKPVACARCASHTQTRTWSRRCFNEFTAAASCCTRSASLTGASPRASLLPSDDELVRGSSVARCSTRTWPLLDIGLSAARVSCTPRTRVCVRAARRLSPCQPWLARLTPSCSATSWWAC
jgi:hypothetical protein